VVPIPILLGRLATLGIIEHSSTGYPATTRIFMIGEAGT
jgi:hypothetical protein